MKNRLISSSKQHIRQKKKQTSTEAILKTANLQRNKNEHQINNYEVALANIIDYVYTFDLQGRFTYVNKPLLDLWGLKLEEAVGKTFKELGYPPHLVKLHNGQLKQVIKTKKPVSGENAYTNYQGRTGYFEYTFVPVLDKKGTVAAIVGSTHDVTDKKIADEAREQHLVEERFQTLADNIQNLCWMAKPDGYIYWYNNRWYQYTGTTPKDMEGWGWQSVHDPKVLPKVLDGWKKSIKTGKPFDMVFPLKGADGIFRPFLTRVMPLKDKSGKIIHWFGTNTDISEQKKAEEEAQLERNRVHELLMQAPAIMVVTKGPNHVYELVNAKYLQNIGKTKSIVGKPAAKVLPELKEQGFIALLDKVYETGEPFIGTEVPVKIQKKKNTKTEYVNFIYQPIKDSTGAVQGIFGHAVDVTEQVLARKKIEESEARFKAIWESVSDAIAISDDKGIVIAANPAYFKLYKYKHNEIVGKYFYTIFPKEQHEMARKQYKEVFYGEKESNIVEAEVKIADGSKRIVESKYDFIRQDGKRIAMVSTVRDITERKALEKQKDEFLGVASHELKTPVTSIKAYGQVLETMFRRKGDLKAAEQLGKMDAQINKLSSLIADLLDVTKIQAGRLSIQEEKFDFNELVDEIISELQLTTERHTLIKELDKSKKIYGDRERIGQVITNLISNAIKYSPHSGKIIIKTTIDSSNIILCVQDFGVGIPQDKKDRVFEQFFRVSGNMQHTFPGLGLGLYISNEIIKRLGGKMWVESIEGKGSTFCFKMPIKRMRKNSGSNAIAEEAIKHE